jgi:hypothetical protein
MLSAKLLCCGKKDVHLRKLSRIEKMGGLASQLSGNQSAALAS